MYKISIDRLKGIKSTLKSSLKYREVSSDYNDWVKKCERDERTVKKIKKLINTLEKEYGV